MHLTDYYSSFSSILFTFALLRYHFSSYFVMHMLTCDWIRIRMDLFYEIRIFLDFVTSLITTQLSMYGSGNKNELSSDELMTSSFRVV